MHEAQRGPLRGQDRPQAATGARLRLAGCHPRSMRVEGPLPATLTRLRPLVPGIPSGSGAACRLALPSERLLPGSRTSFCFDRRFLPAGTGQSGVQAGRRKPVIQGGQAGKTLSGSPRTGCGRVELKTGPDSPSETCPSRARRGQTFERAATVRLWPGPDAHERLLRGRPARKWPVRTSVSFGEA
jgi:hypothetical protein